MRGFLLIFLAVLLSGHCFSQNLVFDTNAEQRGDGLILSPNPLKGRYLHISFKPPLQGTIKKAEVYDILGTRVLVSEKGYRLNAGELEKGIYIVRAYVFLEGNGDAQIKTYHKKLVVK